jgi:hypothetical protein
VISPFWFDLSTSIPRNAAAFASIQTHLVHSDHCVGGGDDVGSIAVTEANKMPARILAVALVLFLASAAAPPRAETIVRPPPPVEVEVRRGVTVKYLALSPKGVPRDAVVLFAGGNGLLNLQPNGSIGNLAGNFLVRSRERFVRENLFVAVVDTPNQVAIDGNVRLSAQYAEDMSRVIADVRSRAGRAQIWLVGTSAGTISAASVAARLPRLPPSSSKENLRRPDGIVLTATQSTVVKGLCGRTVFNANLSAVNVPAFLAHHVDDGCKCSPFGAAGKVLDALSGAPAKDSRKFSGGLPPKSPDPCMAMTPHGFLGIEDQVVGAIADFVRKH